MPFALAHAEREIKKTHGDTVSVIQKSKSLNKFGHNNDLGTTTETIWEVGGTETLPTTNAIDSFSSSDNGDNAVMYVEGHTVSGTGVDQQFTFVTQTVTVAGNAETLLGTALARVSRASVVSGTLDGDFYIYEDDTVVTGVPQTASKIHLKILGSATPNETQSSKCATTVSNTDYGIIMSWMCSIDKKTSASADFELQHRVAGGAFRPMAGKIGLSTGGESSLQVHFDPPLILKKNSDIRVVATASTTGVEVDGEVFMYLAKVV
jgi:hypothetical protein